MSDAYKQREAANGRDVAEPVALAYKGTVEANIERTSGSAGGSDEGMARLHPPITVERVRQWQHVSEPSDMDRAAELARAQRLVSRYVPSNRSLADELMAERRAAAASE